MIVRPLRLLALGVLVVATCGTRMPPLPAASAPATAAIAGTLEPRASLPVVSRQSAPSAVPGATPDPTTTTTATPDPTTTTTATPTTVTPQPVWRFVALGDTRTSGLFPPRATGLIVQRAADAQPAVGLVDGDLINAMNDQPSVREQWRNWRAAMVPLGAQHVLVAAGNHDVQGNAWATELMIEAFPELPRNGPPGYEVLTYALDYGGVRFIALQSEVYGNPHRLGDAQLAWLEQQLTNNPNPYTIVFSHDPAFPIGPHVGSALDVYPAERDRFWAMLRDHSVTAYIAGHEHLYNRQTIDGMTQLVVGTSGSSPYGGFGGDFYHYLVAEVGPGGITCVVYDIDGVERDRFVLNAKR